MIDNYLKRVANGTWLAADFMGAAFVFAVSSIVVGFCFLFLWPLALLSKIVNE